MSEPTPAPAAPTKPGRWLDRTLGPTLGPVARHAAGVLAGVLLAYLLGLVGVKADPTPVEFQQAPDAPAVNYEGARYHGEHGDHAEHVVEVAAARAFPQRAVRYWIDYASAAQIRPPLSADAVSAAIRQAWGWWAEGLDIEPAEVADAKSAHLVMSFDRNVFGRADGPLGVLAACELGDGTTKQKRLVFDAAERWTAGPPAANQLSLPTVGCHELGHWLGLGHDDPTAPAVMRPSYSAALPREQPRDIARAVQLGYKLRAKTPAPPTSDVLTFPVSAKAGDLAEALRKSGWSVESPK